MTHRILFIDDQIDLWGKAFKQELGHFGFDILCEEEPSKALNLISSYKPDAVLLDILFPKGPLGKPTLEKIRKKYSDLPVVMITNTMDKAEYRPEDYALADYRYSKEALTAGDFSDLANLLKKLIEKAQELEEEDDTGLDRFGFIVGTSKAMQEVAEMIEKVVDQDHTVLITGESGTGKELVARSIHAKSERRERNFVTIVCAALSKELLESELFGHEKGAFTGAVSSKRGKFEMAGEGTIFLDEIGEMPIDTQVKLLRFLQERSFERVGGNEVLKSNARIIAATNQDLQDLVTKGKFREDLFFRLNVVSIHMPPLRKRKEDIPLFFKHFVKKSNELSQKNVLPILRQDVEGKLADYPWPGNIRQLENAISRAVALADENILQVSNFSDLCQIDPRGVQSVTNVDAIVEEIINGLFPWEKFKKEFGSGGTARREIFLNLIGRLTRERSTRPTHEDLAELLSVKPGNMRRILHVCEIELTELPKRL